MKEKELESELIGLKMGAVPNFKGITLVELLVVIAIIAALAALLLPALQKALKRAHYASWCGLKQSNKSDRTCVAYWSFEEGTGSTAANLAYGYGDLYHKPENCDGTLKNNPEWIPAGDGRGRFLAKPSLSFDGSNDYVDCGSDNSLNITDAITIEAWVKPQSSNITILSNAYNWTPKRGYRLISSGAGKIELLIGDGTTMVYTTANNPADLNTWAHTVFTWDGAITKMYINSVLQTDTEAFAGPIYYGTALKLYIGRPAGAPTYFNGLIDEVAIFDVALSASEIKKRYRAGRP